MSNLSDIRAAQAPDVWIAGVILGMGTRIASSKVGFDAPQILIEAGSGETLVPGAGVGTSTDRIRVKSSAFITVTYNTSSGASSGVFPIYLNAPEPLSFIELDDDHQSYTSNFPQIYLTGATAVYRLVGADSENSEFTTLQTVPLKIEMGVFYPYSSTTVNANSCPSVIFDVDTVAVFVATVIISATSATSFTFDVESTIIECVGSLLVFHLNLSSAALDALLISIFSKIDTLTGSVFDSTVIEITGPSARTSASDAAVAGLVAEGATLILPT